MVYLRPESMMQANAYRPVFNLYIIPPSTNVIFSTLEPCPQRQNMSRLWSAVMSNGFPREAIQVSTDILSHEMNGNKVNRSSMYRSWFTQVQKDPFPCWLYGIPQEGQKTLSSILYPLRQNSLQFTGFHASMVRVHNTGGIGRNL